MILFEIQIYFGNSLCFQILQDYRFDDKDIEVDQSNANFRVRSVFIIGQTDDAEVQDKLADESLFHGDIVQEQFMESYQNLTLKAVMMMKWVNDNCIGKGIYFEQFDIAKV